MNVASSTPGDSPAFARSYRSALKRHLMGDARSDLKAARRLGQRAMKAGFDLLGLANFHQAALEGLNSWLSSMPHASNGARKCREFFEAVILPLEETHLAATAANGRLEKSIQSLKRRTEDLAVTNRELRAEISRRKEVEASLRTSETTTSLLLKKSHRLQDELRLLSRRLLTVQEDERRQISRELHDVIAQTLAGINIRLAVLRSQTSANAKDFHEKIEVTERLVEKSVEIVHRFASDLRPLVLDDLGLIPALQSYLRSFEVRTRVSVRLTAQPVVEMLDPAARTATFRIAQEALINIARHAKASHVTIDLRPGKACVRMRIRDDGKGFDVEGVSPAHGVGHLGLLGMRERAEMVGGTLRIESKRGQGTTVWVEIPRADAVTEVSPKPEPAPTKKSR